jgi:hypothetical protein
VRELNWTSKEEKNFTELCQLKVYQVRKQVDYFTRRRKFTGLLSGEETSLWLYQVGRLNGFYQMRKLYYTLPQGKKLHWTLHN